MAERLSFHDEIAKNKVKSFLLLIGIFALFLALGYLISFAVDPSFFFLIMIVSIIISLVYIWAGYFFSDRIALASVRAQPASRQEHSALINSVESMSIASGLPMPKVYVMQSDQINAFASGRDPKHAVICVTTGAIRKLSRQELEGVIAHEMAHIANYDIRFITLATVLVGLISIAGEIFLRSLWFSSSSRDDNKGNAIVMIAAVALAILAPIIANLIALAISRKREFAADATGVKFTRYPVGLKNALLKIKHEHLSDADRKRYTKTLAPLFISDPFKKRFQSLFSTHPDIDERISRLSRM